MNIILVPLLIVILYVLKLYLIVIFARVIFSWLAAFGVINTYNHITRSIGGVLTSLTDPALRPLRRFIPDFGSVDLTPLALCLIVFFFQMVVGNLLVAVQGV